MIVKLLAAGVLLVPSGTIMINDNYKFANALQTVINLVIGWW
jgi:hypothetical protein